MSYIDYNSKNNSISILKTFKKKGIEYKTIDTNVNYNTLEKNNKFIGIELNNFLNKFELIGRKAEEKFKDLLEKNKVPFLYIGQGPVGIEYSNALKNISHSKRPDFLINIPDLGILFIDVKCRRKIGFISNGQKYFQLFNTEITDLVNLHEQLLVPVWLAFYDENLMNSENKTFQMIPISILNRFIKAMREKLTERDFSLLTAIRIPDELFFEMNEDLVFKTGLTNLNPKLINDFSDKHFGLVTRIQDEIKNSIRNNELLKTNVSENVIRKCGKEMFFGAEINLVLKRMIEEKAINYNPKKPLSLLGE